MGTIIKGTMGAMWVIHGGDMGPIIKGETGVMVVIRGDNCLVRMGTIWGAIIEGAMRVMRTFHAANVP